MCLIFTFSKRKPKEIDFKVNLGRFLADFLMIIFMDFRRLHLAIAYPVPNYCQNQIKKLPKISVVSIQELCGSGSTRINIKYSIK